MSRRDDDPPSLVSTMYRLFQEELIHRSPKDGELPIFMVSSGACCGRPVAQCSTPHNWRKICR
ncbi:unnamed protein product [Cladocopium goreaui]|uniref:Uncharacterized protein n=1 Tax=Cladocopium goreaui TaxID=2562237 RepID=A0A9P1DIV5_9DINO|nr:unnamed protein product [Cladocopium goreaui]